MLSILKLVTRNYFKVSVNKEELEEENNYD